MRRPFVDTEILSLLRSSRADVNVSSVSWSPDGTKIATAGTEPLVLIWDSANLSLERQLDQGHRAGGGAGGHTVAFTVDGRYLVSGLKTVNVWDTVDWQKKLSLIASFVDLNRPQAIGVRSLTLLPDMQTILAGYSTPGELGNPIVAFQLRDGAVRWSYEQQSTIGTPLVGTPVVTIAGSNLVSFGTGERQPRSSGDRERLARVLFLDSTTGRLARSIEHVHVDAATALAASADGRWIATGTSTGTHSETRNTVSGKMMVLDNTDPIRVWEVGSGKLVKELPVKSRVWALAFTPDAKYLLSSQSDIQTDRTLSVWNLDTGLLAQAIELPSDLGAPFDLVFNPKGTEVAVGGGQRLSIFRYQVQN